MSAEREPFGGRYHGIFNVEGDDPAPLVIFPRKSHADAELTRRQALPDDADDYADEHHQVFPLDVIGVWWNCYDPDPRADNPLTPDEVRAAYEGEDSAP